MTAYLEATPATREAGWLPGTALADPRVLADAIDGCAATWDAPSPAAAAMFWKTYTYWAARPAVTGWSQQRRVPDMSLASVRVRLSAQLPYVEIRPTDPRYALPAARADAAVPGHDEVVADEVAQLHWLRRTLVEDHLLVVGAALREVVRMGWRNVWGSIAAGCVYPVTDRDDASELLAALQAPYPDLVDLVETTDGDGLPRPYPMRRTCCLAFRSSLGQVCANCPVPANGYDQ